MSDMSDMSEYKWEMPKPHTTDPVKWKSIFFEIMDWTYENISISKWDCNNKGKFSFERQEDFALFKIFISSIEIPTSQYGIHDVAFIYAPYIPLTISNSNITISNSINNTLVRYTGA